LWLRLRRVDQGRHNSCITCVAAHIFALLHLYSLAWKECLIFFSGPMLLQEDNHNLPTGTTKRPRWYAKMILELATEEKQVAVA
jgi:hypothetical protein